MGGAYVSGVAVDELFFGGGHFNLSNAQMQCVLHPAQRPKNCPPGMDVWSTDFYILCFSTMAVALLAICVQRLLSANYADSEPDVYVQPQARRYYAVKKLENAQCAQKRKRPPGCARTQANVRMYPKPSPLCLLVHVPSLKYTGCWCAQHD